MPDMYAARRWGRNCFVSGGGDFDIAAKLVADEIKTMQEAQVYISNFVIARAHKHEVLHISIHVLLLELGRVLGHHCPSTRSGLH